MSDLIKEAGITIKIEQDTDAFDPRTEYDNLGTMVCWHDVYELGDKHNFKTPEEFNTWLEELKQIAIVLPLYLFDHSGISISTSSGKFRGCDPQGWDWGQVGWIYLPLDKVREEYGDGPDAIEKATAYLEGEVETYDQYLTDDVWGYIIEDEDGEHLDSCWGFYGYAYCEEEAKSMAEYHAKEILAQREVASQQESARIAREIETSRPDMYGTGCAG